MAAPVRDLIAGQEGSSSAKWAENIQNILRQ